MKQKNNYSIIKELRKKNKSNDYFEIMLANLTLEEIISAKLELTFKSTGVLLYGFTLWQSLPNLCREAMLKYAISITNSKTEASRYLGLEFNSFIKVLKKYNLYNIYNKENFNVINRTADEEDLSTNITR